MLGETLPQGFRTISRRADCNAQLAPLASKARYKNKLRGGGKVTQESPKYMVPGFPGVQSGGDPALSLSHSGG